MNSELGNRDENGILKGTFELGGGAFPIEILPHIVPFLFPCEECQSITFHVVGEQHSGIGIKIPFMRKPLASTGKGHQAICNTCMNISGVLPNDTFAKLEKGIISAQISAVYDAVFDSPEPYTDGFIEAFMAQCEPGWSNKQKARTQELLAAYRRE